VGKLSPVGTSANIWPIVPAPDDRWWVWSSRWNDKWQGKPKYSEKTCPNATLSTNPIWPDLGSNTGRRSGNPATNRLSYGTAICGLNWYLPTAHRNQSKRNLSGSIKSPYNLRHGPHRRHRLQRIPILLRAYPSPRNRCVYRAVTWQWTAVLTEELLLWANLLQSIIWIYSVVFSEKTITWLSINLILYWSNWFQSSEAVVQYMIMQT
jgi:hypothetical protein